MDRGAFAIRQVRALMGVRSSRPACLPLPTHLHNLPQPTSARSLLKGAPVHVCVPDTTPTSLERAEETRPVVKEKKK